MLRSNSMNGDANCRAWGGSPMNLPFSINCKCGARSRKPNSFFIYKKNLFNVRKNILNRLNF